MSGGTGRHAQLLAAALGARVYKGPAEEIGFGDVTLTEEGARDPVLAADGADGPRGGADRAAGRTARRGGPRGGADLNLYRRATACHQSNFLMYP